MPLQDKSRKQINLPGRKLEKLLDNLSEISNDAELITLDLVQPVFRELIHQEIQLLIDQPDYPLLTILSDNVDLDIFNIQQVGDILFLMASDLHFTDSEAENLYRHCRTLYQYVQNNNTAYSMDIHLKLQQIQLFLTE